ncbi:MAG: UDP-N-acetylmuramoyl-tripeptide--D-alanyl-D-alanine ligase [Bacteroidetes bacterium]|nr:UDP-N-acetylmuramoyl-tripeptide--D-alanyl-D-alanine ligase [Bacteroidota bacterium]
MIDIKELYQIYLQHPSVQTDTRKLKSGDVFFALKGENFNGNKFVKQALENGASYAVIDEKEFEIQGKTLLVNDVLSALQDLAKYHREQFNIPIIAITGSNGKTTTKELIHAVLTSTYKTYTTEGNLNNHIGIPLTILKIKLDAEMAVIEMGANHQKEIESYCQYAMPTHGLITNCGKAHLEGFGGEEGVRKGKGELFDYLRKNNGIAFIMQDYPYLNEMSKGISEIISYGTANATIAGKILASEPFLKIQITKGPINEIQTHLVGSYNFPNVMAAAVIGNYFNISADKIKKAIENYIPSNSRSQLLEVGSNKIILDAYNANPSSMKLAIENIASINTAHKVLLLGAMAELGAESLAEHKAIVELINTKQWDNVVLVGGDFLKFKHPYISFKNAEEAKEWYQQQNFEHTTLLIKGSRSMQMEKILAR